MAYTNSSLVEFTRLSPTVLGGDAGQYLCTDIEAGIL